MKTIIPNNLFDDSTTIGKYDLMSFYDNYVLQKQYYPYQFNGWDDKKFYGILDLNKTPIYPKQSGLSNYFNNDGMTQTNIKFVVDAFKDMKAFQERLLKKGRSANSSIYSVLNVKESTIDFSSKYHTFLGKIYNIFINDYMTDIIRQDTKNIFDFFKHFIIFAKIMCKITVLNRSAFLKSKHTPQSVNGLRISLENPDPNTSVFIKGNNFIGNPEFDLFIETASKFGFLIDKNYPWVLVADIESVSMKKYIRKYNITDTENLFDTFYHKAYTADLESLKHVLIGFWNGYAASFASTAILKENLDCKKYFYEPNHAKQIDSNMFDVILGANWLIRMYALIRVLEEKLNITQNQFEIIFQEACKINKISTEEKALLYINKKLLEYSVSEQAIISDNLTNPDIIVRLMKEQSATVINETINF